MQKIKETGMRLLFALCACISILSAALICWFLFSNGIPAIGETGADKFLLGERWKPLENQFGIFPMIIGSIYVTAGAVLVGVPIGILCAVFLARFCPPRLHRLLKPAVDLLAGIPSIVYGFFGLVVIVPLVQSLFGGSGKGILTASVLLGIMILPTIIAVVCPIVVGLILGHMGVVGMLAGATVTGFLMAIYMANAGGAWDNAKKYIEAGNFGGKGSECHKAGVVGDTVGDPFKDTSGPAINILIKLLSMVSIVFAGLIVNYSIL